MIDKLSKMAAIGAVAIAAMSTSALAQEWDMDGDGMLNQDEWNTGWNESGVFNDWDGDGDGMLTSDEFNTGVYGGYDRDGDGMLNDEEYTMFNDDMGNEGFWGS